MASPMPGAALDTTADHERRHLVIRSDRGCHYRRPGWMGICEEAGMARSMSRKGCSLDDSRMEGLFGTMKTEVLHGRDWAGVTLDELGQRVDAYTERHNTTRIKRSLGSMSPPRYRRSLGLAAWARRYGKAVPPPSRHFLVNNNKRISQPHGDGRLLRGAGTG